MMKPFTKDKGPFLMVGNVHFITISVYFIMNSLYKVEYKYGILLPCLKRQKKHP